METKQIKEVLKFVEIPFANTNIEIACVAEEMIYSEDNKNLFTTIKISLTSHHNAMSSAKLELYGVGSEELKRIGEAFFMVAYETEVIEKTYNNGN